MISPSGGVIAASGSIRSTPSKPQNEGGNFGQISRTFRFEPSGGNVCCCISGGTVSVVRAISYSVTERVPLVVASRHRLELGAKQAFECRHSRAGTRSVRC